MLDVRVDRLEAAVKRLANAQTQTQADLRTLVVTVKNLADAVADLKGEQFERHYCEQDRKIRLAFHGHDRAAISQDHDAGVVGR